MTLNTSIMHYTNVLFWFSGHCLCTLGTIWYPITWRSTNISSWKLDFSQSAHAHYSVSMGCVCNNDSNDPSLSHTFDLANEPKRHQDSLKFLAIATQWCSIEWYHMDFSVAISWVIPWYVTWIAHHAQDSQASSMRSNVLFVSHKQVFVRGHLYTRPCVTPPIRCTKSKTLLVRGHLYSFSKIGY